MTMAERVQTIIDASGVIAALVSKPATPVSGFPTISIAEVTYHIIAGDLVQNNTVSLVVIDQGEVTEAAYWRGRLPSILQPATVADTYFGTSGTTAAQVETYVNSKWTTANPGAGDIKDVSVNVVDSNTVRIEGLFDVSGAREQRTYIIWLIDPEGTVGGANAKFERVV